MFFRTSSRGTKSSISYFGQRQNTAVQERNAWDNLNMLKFLTLVLSPEEEGNNMRVRTVQRHGSSRMLQLGFSFLVVSVLIDLLLYNHSMAHWNETQTNDVSLETNFGKHSPMQTVWLTFTKPFHVHWGAMPTSWSYSHNTKDKD
jgi:hypothetical protein